MGGGPTGRQRESPTAVRESPAKVEGIEYQQGPLYRTQLRAFIAERERHRCAYCGEGYWEDRTRFNLDHVQPRAQGGATNVGNLAWAYQRCSQAKGAQRSEAFLENEPERRDRIRSRKRTPLAAAEKQKWLCDTLVKAVTQTTGADTAPARRSNGIAKSHASDAACAGATGRITERRRAGRLKAIRDGRRKLIKGLPTAEYLGWRHRAPSERRALGAPRPATHPRTVHGIRTGERVQIGGRNGVARGPGHRVRPGEHDTDQTTRRNVALDNQKGRSAADRGKIHVRT